ncbi:MAG TPA: hypothetical protein VFV07_09190 [Rhizomicrobium sp.]|nr:hypothetical protein [Rhizomicrobium sp.]
MEQPGPRRGVAGGIALLVLGLVILVPSGLCTGIMAIGAIVSMFQYPSAVGLLPTALVVGGPFVAAGGVLVWLGVRRLRGRDGR